MSSLPAFRTEESKLFLAIKDLQCRGIVVRCTKEKAVLKTSPDLYRQWEAATTDASLVFWDIMRPFETETIVTLGLHKGDDAVQLYEQVGKVIENSGGTRVC